MLRTASFWVLASVLISLSSPSMAQPYQLVATLDGTSILDINATLSSSAEVDTRDYYQITMPDTGLLLVDILFSDADGDIDAYLYELTSTSPLTTATLDGSGSVSDNEQLESAVTAGTDYLIEVLCFNGCTAESVLDEFEPNNSLGQPFDVSPQDNDSGTVSSPAPFVLLTLGFAGLTRFRRLLAPARA